MQEFRLLLLGKQAPYGRGWMVSDLSWACGFSLRGNGTAMLFRGSMDRRCGRTSSISITITLCGSALRIKAFIAFMRELPITTGWRTASQAVPWEVFSRIGKAISG